MYDVILFGNPDFECEKNLIEKEFSRELPHSFKEKEDKVKKKKVFNEETSTYYFPSGNKRKASCQTQKPDKSKKAKIITSE